MTALLFTVLGLLSTLVGIAYAGVALLRQNRGHGTGQPIWLLPRKIASWLRRHTLRKPVPKAYGGGTIDAQADISATLSVIKAKVPEDAPISEQIRMLVKRIESIESAAESDRQRSQESIRTLRTEIDNGRAQVKQETSAIRTKMADVAVGTIELEAAALLWIGAGSVLMAVSAIIQGFSM